MRAEARADYRDVNVADAGLGREVGRATFASVARSR